ncbi:aspartate aminotransferase [Spirochaetia bacterium]|nr:aspartate aminotransferase [Spirochaetia bacterium]GHU33205.1 aspartate aminotransferase [Spirochaetia bacterium]
MPVATSIKESLRSSSLIRKMFEEGNRLKKLYGAENVFDFSLGNPDVEPPPAFHAVFLKCAQEDPKGSHSYMQNAGYPAVREALACKAGREHNVTLDADHIIMSVGAAGGLNVVFKSILNPGDEIIVSRPYFVEYRSYVENHGGTLVPVDTLPDFNLDVQAIQSRLSPKTAGVLINSPHNPTGRVYPAATLAALADCLCNHGKQCGRYPYLIADEPYREIVYNGVVPPVLAVYDESIVINSYSKNLSLPGERIGYIAVSPTIADKETVVNALIHSTRVLGFTNAPALMQRIVAELTEARVDTSVYARRLAAFKKVLDAAGIEYAQPDGAFYLFCKAPDADDKAFVERLKQNLILGVPGTGFGSPGWVRFAYCVDETIIEHSKNAFLKTMGK